MTNKLKKHKTFLGQNETKNKLITKWGLPKVCKGTKRTGKEV